MNEQRLPEDVWSKLRQLRDIDSQIEELLERKRELQQRTRDLERAAGRISSPRKHPDRTANREFVLPILKALIEAGGSLKPAEVGDRVKFALRHRLTGHDFTIDPSGTRPRWDDGMRYCRKELVESGLLDDKERGVWNITEIGRRFYIENTKSK